MIYAQAEDDFNRVETNYLNSMGRLAEAEGESEIYRDLRMKLFIDPDSMKAQYAASPAWLKALMNAWADGLNYYLYTHPAGEAAGDHAVRAVDGAHLQRGQHRRRHRERQPRRSSRRSTATAPSRRRRVRRRRERRADGADGIERHRHRAVEHRRTTALLLINPHTSFFFRSELQMTSDEGLNAYGAVTWGQFFIYQGFNDRARLDAHLERRGQHRRVRSRRSCKKGDGFFYRYGSEERPLVTRARSPCPTRPRPAWRTKDVHGLPHASRADRARGGRQVGQRPADAGAARRR